MAGTKVYWYLVYFEAYCSTTGGLNKAVSEHNFEREGEAFFQRGGKAAKGGG